MQFRHGANWVHLFIPKVRGCAITLNHFSLELSVFVAKDLVSHVRILAHRARKVLSSAYSNRDVKIFANKRKRIYCPALWTFRFWIVVSVTSLVTGKARKSDLANFSVRYFRRPNGHFWHVLLHQLETSEMQKSTADLNGFGWAPKGVRLRVTHLSRPYVGSLVIAQDHSYCVIPVVELGQIPTLERLWPFFGLNFNKQTGFYESMCIQMLVMHPCGEFYGLSELNRHFVRVFHLRKKLGQLTVKKLEFCLHFLLLVFCFFENSAALIVILTCNFLWKSFFLFYPRIHLNIQHLMLLSFFLIILDFIDFG